MSDFNDAKVGDKLWSIQLGECEVTFINSEVISCKSYKVDQFDSFKEEDYWINGKHANSDQIQSLYWSQPIQSLYWFQPKIIAPEKPKLKKLYAYEWQGSSCVEFLTYEKDCSDSNYIRKPEYDIEYK